MREQSNKTSPIHPNLPLGIFCFLLLARLVAGLVLANTDGRDSLVFFAFFTVVSLALFTFVIWLNKWNLGDLNIDRYFIYTFIISSLLLVLYFSFSLVRISLISIATLICLLFTLRALRLYKFEFNDKKHNYQIFLYVILGIAPVILLKLYFHKSSAFINSFLSLSADQFFWYISTGLWGVVFEEFLFRGLLWMILSKWSFDKKKIILTQAFLFWLVHLNLIVQPYFGINAFLFGLWLGYLTLRSKSLMPGTLTHFVWNITANLITGI